jgi:hypothetical protein
MNKATIYAKEGPFWRSVSNTNQSMYTESLKKWSEAISDLDIHKNIQITSIHKSYHKDIVHFLRNIAVNKGPSYLNGPPWKNTLHPTGCDKWISAQCDEKRKKAAKVYCDHLRYIPFDEFLHELTKLYQSLPKKSYFVMLLNKSSEFILILLSMLDPTIMERIIIMDMNLSYYLSEMKNNSSESMNHINFIDSMRYQIEWALHHLSPDEELDLVLLDDMSYSAGQVLAIQTSIFDILHNIIIEYMDKIPKYSVAKYRPIEYTNLIQRLFKLRIHIAFVYITEKAHNILKGKEIYEPYEHGQIIPLWGDYTLHLPNIIPSLRKQVGDDMFKAIGAYFGYPSYYSEDQIAPDSIVYFDHKVADVVSTIGLPIVKGATAPGKGNVNSINYNKLNTMESIPPEKWVLNYLSNNTGKCSEIHPIIPSCARGNINNNSSFPYEYPNDICPFPWFKSMNSMGQIKDTSRNKYKRLFPHLPLKGGDFRGKKTRTQKGKKGVKRRYHTRRR